MENKRNEIFVPCDADEAMLLRGKEDNLLDNLYCEVIYEMFHILNCGFEINAVVNAISATV